MGESDVTFLFLEKPRSLFFPLCSEAVQGAAEQDLSLEGAGRRCPPLPSPAPPAPRSSRKSRGLLGHAEVIGKTEVIHSG